MGCRLQLLQGPFADIDTERNSRWQLHHHWMHLKGPARGTAYRRVCPWSGLSSLWTGLSIHERAGPSMQGTGLMMNMACHETRTSGSENDLESSVLVHELTFVTITGRLFIDRPFSLWAGNPIHEIGRFLSRNRTIHEPMCRADLDSPADDAGTTINNPCANAALCH